MEGAGLPGKPDFQCQNHHTSTKNFGSFPHLCTMGAKKSGSSDSIIPQAKLLRLFQIIAVLKTGKWSIRNLAERFDTSERTIYRYLKLLEEVEFLVDKDFDNNFFIVTSDEEPGTREFTTEEMKLIKKLIQSEVDDNPLRVQLIRKLSLNSELDKVPRIITKARLGKLVDQLSHAMRDKKQVILKNYHSANSNEIADRLIEPVSFGDNYQTIVALDTRDKTNKQFKLDRIAEIVELNKPFEFSNLHQNPTADIFGMTGKQVTMITLKMKMRAYLLIREEFPMSIPYLSKTEDGEYQFHGPVNSLEGVGRFVLGLIDLVKVVGPTEFIGFVRQKIEQQSAINP